MVFSPVISVEEKHYSLSLGFCFWFGLFWGFLSVLDMTEICSHLQTMRQVPFYFHLFHWKQAHLFVIHLLSTGQMPISLKLRKTRSSSKKTELV